MVDRSDVINFFGQIAIVFWSKYRAKDRKRMRSFYCVGNAASTRLCLAVSACSVARSSGAPVRVARRPPCRYHIFSPMGEPKGWRRPLPTPAQVRFASPPLSLGIDAPSPLEQTCGWCSRGVEIGKAVSRPAHCEAREATGAAPGCARLRVRLLVAFRTAVGFGSLVGSGSRGGQGGLVTGESRFERGKQIQHSGAGKREGISFSFSRCT